MNSQTQHLLSFPTASQGNIAFGFFNIESDMLLLQQYFFFADDFCRFTSCCAENREWNPVVELEVFRIAKLEDVGDLMGAINGIRYTGFIGDTYRHFHFLMLWWSLSRIPVAMRLNHYSGR